MGYLKNMLNQDPDESHYVGNFFGWKTSFIGLGVILICCGIIAYGHFSGKMDIRTGEPILKHSVTSDSTLKK
jgi:hypothetical protein